MVLSLGALVLVATILTIISLLSSFVIYQLFSNLCCYKCTNAASPQQNPNPSPQSSGVSVGDNRTDVHNPSEKDNQNPKPKILPFFRNSTLTASTIFFVVSILINIDRLISPNPCGIFVSSLMLSFALLFVSSDIVFSCILLYLYLKKLSVLVQGGDNHQDTHLIHLITRYTLLYTVCFISTIMVLVISMMLSLVIQMHPEEKNRFLMIWFSLDSFVNLLSLWLKMSFARNWYFKLCKFGHNKCTNYFGGLTGDDLTLKQIQSNTTTMSTTV